jgi:arabinan endo-1,5-alpha-L-arabinosidase
MTASSPSGAGRISRRMVLKPSAATAGADAAAAAEFGPSTGADYYLVGSRCACCAGTRSSYHMVVGRSTSPTGPFLDKKGGDTASGGGTTVLTGKFPRGAAGGDLFEDGSRHMFAHHFYDAKANGRQALNFRPITLSADDQGWTPPLG